MSGLRRPSALAGFLARLEGMSVNDGEDLFVRRETERLLEAGWRRDETRPPHPWEWWVPPGGGPAVPRPKAVSLLGEGRRP